eukprot:TRINITY_DN948_c0_g1_i1.p1 TRINITY_DN948_c0_g1~~TRINITY_DN948_c0_g1_i1.p1  ORF type:complete len:413 (+),score=113.29 TRINITY_DN948_c0_g1_i1:29-1240(+)
MASFVAPAVNSVQAPRLVPGVSASGTVAAAQLPAPLDGALRSSDAGSFFTSATVLAVTAAVFSAFRFSRNRRSRVARQGSCGGPRGMCWYEYKFRSKPGSKFKYRYSTDVWTPEFGVWPNVEPDRIIKYGKLLNKGTPTLPVEGHDDNLLDDWDASGALGGEVEGGLLLDCDGTLVETERDGHRVAFNKAFKEKGFDIEWDVELYGELLTTGGGKERMTRYFTDINPDAWTDSEPPSKSHPVIMELHELKTKLFMDIVKSGELPLRPGMKELLTAATKAGWKLAVCSTSNEASVTAVVETMLPDFAGSMAIYAGDIVSAKKPDPAVYQLACKELGLAPMKCVVVEDTAIGAQAGKAAGMKVVVTKSVYSANEEFGDADLVVESAEEVDFAKDVAALLPVLQLT